MQEPTTVSVKLILVTVTLFSALYLYLNLYKYICMVELLEKRILSYFI